MSPKRGRPSKLTDELVERVRLLVAAGNPLQLAAEACGVQRQTLHAWIRRGERGGATNEPYRTFAAAVEQARAEAEGDLVAQVRKASASGSWRAAAWLLERSAPDRWVRDSSARGKRAAAPEEESSAADGFAEVDQLAQRRAVHA